MAESEIAAKAGRTAERVLDSRLRKIVFVCFGAFDSNSAGHVTGFANALAGMGYAVAVCCAGSIGNAYAFGTPAFAFFTLDQFARDSEGVIGFDEKFEPERTVLVAWTPRENVRRVVAPIAARHAIPYVVHLEDNEELLAKLEHDAAARRSRWPWRRARPVPDAVTDPAQLAGFLGGAAGLTLIEERLREIVPANVPAIVLEPGLDLDAFARDLPPHRRATIRRSVGCSLTTAMLVYPGNVHQANADEVSSLYEAVRLLRSRGRDVMLVRTGSDHFARATFLKEARPEDGIVTLGQVERSFLIDLLKSADLFVQPGRPGAFNDYRLPSKLPEFLAVGRPVVLPATNVGSRLRDGVDALLLRVGSAEEIAAKVETILSDALLAERLSAKSQEFAARHYRLEDQAAKLESFLRQIV